MGPSKRSGTRESRSTRAVRRDFRLGPYTTALAVAWTAIVGVSLAWNLHEQERAMKEVARTQARAGFEKDILYRRWNAIHGGVYVPVTKTTPPNPHLDVPERDIKTPSGRALTLVNPAYMTRQVHELGVRASGIQGHITSLNPIRPENAPDPWETAALEAFERGEAEEHSSIEVFRGEPHLRLMCALKTEKGCLKCHAAQGYQEGDVRGGISVSVPMAPLWAIGRATTILIVAWHGFFWVLGLGGIGLSYRHLRGRITDRDQAELDLLQSEAKFRTLYDSTSDAVMLLDEKGFFDCNDATVRIFGCKDKAEFCNKHPAELSPTEQPCGIDSMTLANQRIATAMEKGSNRFEWMHKRLDTGEDFPVEVLLNAMELDGRPVLQAVVRDIGDRRRAEKEIRESEARFRDVALSTSDWVWEVDAEGYYTYCSEKIRDILGFTAEELIGRTPFDLMSEQESARVKKIVSRLTADKEPIKDLENRNIAKNGHEVILLTNGVPRLDEGGNLLGYRGVDKDITDRNRADEALRESEQRFMDVLYAADDAILLIDGETFVDCNDATVRMLGYPCRDELLMTHPSELSPPMQPDGRSSFEKAGEMIRTAFEKGFHRFEWIHRKSNGEDFPVEVSLTPITYQGKTILHCLWRDLTDRKRTEEERKKYATALESANKALMESNEAAEAASRAKSEFLANMSHEIRTPLTAILGFSDMLLGNVKDEENLSSANTIKRNGKHLLGLINDILDLSKIEAGKLEIEHITCSPGKVVADVASLMRVRARAKGLPLKIEYVGKIPETILCDPIRLRQILINMLGNAIKFTETGNVRLVVRLVQDNGRPPYLRFDVIDTGIGVTQEQASRLFQPFSQADSSTARKFGGTGLGLTISKRLAEVLGGNITMSSQPGKGSTFSVTVETGPLDDVPMLKNVVEATAWSRQEAKATAAPAVKLDCRILLAEDGPDNQRLISFILKKAGAKVTLAENGLIAHDKALAARAVGEPFDIILMDMQMPVMDGYEATRRLRDEGYAGPIIALTANVMSGDDRKCREAGCDDYLSKPIERNEFLPKLAQYAEKQKQP